MRRSEIIIFQSKEADMENKQEILNKLLVAIQATRAGEDVETMVYDAPSEMVLVYFGKSKEPGRKINVACDSGIAMLRDVLRNIDI